MLNPFMPMHPDADKCYHCTHMINIFCSEKCEACPDFEMQYWYHGYRYQPERSKREDSKDITPIVFNCCWDVDILVSSSHRNDETCEKYLYEMRCSELQRKPGEVG